MSAPEEMPVFPSADRRDPSVIRDNQVILMLVFAGFTSTKYGLSISVADALKLLQD